jgi:hypothetical protein
MIVSVGVGVGEVVISFLLDEQPVKISVDKNNKIIFFTFIVFSPLIDILKL